jgi:lysozyme
MKTSTQGRRAIMAREGVRLKAYQDVAGVWTIGYGHTPSHKGETITQKEAEYILEADLGRFERAVSRAITKPMTQNQFDAMVSLAFNIGEAAFDRSTVARLFNLGDIDGAADAFLLWRRAGTNPTVLLPRRRQEREQFLKVTKDPAQASPESPFTRFFRWLSGLFG